MAKGPTTLSELREQEYTQSIGTATVGGVIVLIAVILLMVLGYFLQGSTLLFARVGMGIGILIGVIILVSAVLRITKINKASTTMFRCPYCNAENRLVKQPTEDFDCDSCHTTIRFEHGKMVPVKTITCPTCGAQHRVSEKTERYLCDQCNTQMDLRPAQPVYGMASTASAPRSGVLLGGANQTVEITRLDRSRTPQVAAILQKEMGLNQEEAMHLLGTITEQTPLIVAYDVSHIDADGLRRQLVALGAAVEVRDTVNRLG